MPTLAYNPTISYLYTHAHQEPRGKRSKSANQSHLAPAFGSICSPELQNYAMPTSPVDTLYPIRQRSQAYPPQLLKQQLVPPELGLYIYKYINTQMQLYIYIFILQYTDIPDSHLWPLLCEERVSVYMSIQHNLAHTKVVAGWSWDSENPHQTCITNHM